MKKILFLIFLLLIFSCKENKNAEKDNPDLEAQINNIIKGKKATVAISVMGLDQPAYLYINGNTQLPMQSVFKFHIALAVLNEVDKGKLDLNQKILIKKSDLIENTWSPIREKYPEGNAKLTLAEIIKYTVAQSDNIGCDILLNLVGGTKTVQNFMNEKKVKNFQIKYTEAEMQQNWDRQYENYSSTESIVNLLADFSKNEIVSKASTDFLMKIMLETTTGENKLVAKLPKNTPLAHKTGSSGKNKSGLTGAENDMGIITLPFGDRYAICVFVTNSMESQEVNEKMIADISKSVWDYFINLNSQ